MADTMKLLTLLCSLLLLLATVTTTAAASDKWPLEPKDFRGVPFGASVADMRVIIVPAPNSPVNCAGDMLTNKDLLRRLTPAMQEAGASMFRLKNTCTQLFSIGGVSTKQEFVFHEDKLVQVDLSFASAAFDKLRDIFTIRYGPPTESHTEPIRTKSGSSFENSVSVWVGQKVTVRLQQFSETIDGGSALIIDNLWGEEYLRLLNDAKKKAATTF
jgi:hypothetical protein